MTHRNQCPSTAFIPCTNHIRVPRTFDVLPNNTPSSQMNAFPSSHLSNNLPDVLLATETITTTNNINNVGITAAAPPQTFEAVAPDPSLFIGMGSVVLLCIAAGFVWANDVVPVSRTKLAISKSRGEVRDYLDGLRTPDDAVATNSEVTSGTNTAITKDIYKTEHNTNDNDDKRMKMNQMDEKDSLLIKPNVGDGRDFERWLFSDWLNKPTGKGGRQKEPALPILKEAKWNSGDNPVLVTAAIMMVGVILASVTERIATS